MENNKLKRSFFEHKSVAIMHIICCLIIFMTIIATIVMTIINGEITINKMFEHLFLCIISLILINIPLFIERKFKLYIPAFVQIIVILFIVAHFVLGEIYRLYDYSLLFDKILHTISGVIIAILGFSIINLLNKSDKMHMMLSPFFVALFSFCFALTIACLWEIFEFAMDSILKINMQRWQDSFQTIMIDGEEVLIMYYGQGNGIIDTMGDMIVSTIGAAVISITGYILLKKESPKINSLLLKSYKEPLSEKQKDE